MGFIDIVTLIFIVLKLTGVITWSWWLILLPEIAVGILEIVKFSRTRQAKRIFRKYFGGLR